MNALNEPFAFQMRSLSYFRFFMMLSLVMIVSLSLSSSLSSAKEIEATNEWQLLKPGDTIPAGLHVRMDLETGQKWAKLVDGQEKVSSSKKAVSTSTSKDSQPDDITTGATAISTRTSNSYGYSNQK